MITRRQKDFLIDLAKLFDKHGTQPFEELADLLSSPETIELCVNFLRTSSLAAQKAGFEQSGKRKGGARRAIKSELERIKSEDPEKHKVLIQFHNALLSKTVLPNLKDIRNFAQNCKLPVVTAKRREQAISPLLQSMIPLGADAIKKMIESLPHSHTQPFNDLEGWADIIIKKRE